MRRSVRSTVVGVALTALGASLLALVPSASQAAPAAETKLYMHSANGGYLEDWLADIPPLSLLGDAAPSGSTMTTTPPTGETDATATTLDPLGLPGSPITATFPLPATGGSFQTACFDLWASSMIADSPLGEIPFVGGELHIQAQVQTGTTPETVVFGGVSSFSTLIVSPYFPGDGIVRANGLVTLPAPFELAEFSTLAFFIDFVYNLPGQLADTTLHYDSTSHPSSVTLNPSNCGTSNGIPSASPSASESASPEPEESEEEEEEEDCEPEASESPSAEESAGGPLPYPGNGVPDELIDTINDIINTLPVPVAKATDENGSPIPCPTGSASPSGGTTTCVPAATTSPEEEEEEEPSASASASASPTEEAGSDDPVAILEGILNEILGGGEEEPPPSSAPPSGSAEPSESEEEEEAPPTCAPAAPLTTTTTTYTGAKGSMYADIITFSARVTTPSGAPVTTGAVEFLLGGNVYRAPMGNNGVATVRGKVVESPGTYRLLSRYMQNGPYGFSEAASSFSVSKAKTYCTMAREATPNASKLTATLRRGDGAGVSGVNTIFSYKTSAQKNVITDSAGYARYTSPTKGTRGDTFSNTFNGNAYYTACAASTRVS